MSANALSLTEAAAAVRDGVVTSVELVRACLDRIVEFEDNVGAWAHVNPEFALAQAEEADSRRERGLPMGPLHGVPIGIKDIIDTADLPTELGTVLHAGRQPEKDAPLVSALRQAGAIILGKTVSTEMAVFGPGKTKNPHDPTRTPGGSSSGSAASVAAFMVHGSIGTQTNGSVIRPASFCGVYGYKPTHGLISRTGVLKESTPLDTIGVFGRTLEDVAALAEPLMGYDDRDPSMEPVAAPHLTKGVAATPVGMPKFLFVRSPVWNQADDDAKDGFRELIEHVSEIQGQTIEIFDLPSAFDEAHEVHRIIMEHDLAVNFADEYARGKEQMTDILIEMLERGQKITDDDYQAAIEKAELLKDGFGDLFDDYDALITPAAPGQAPVGLETTGSPAFCTIWTLTGMPSLSLPLLQGADGMPIGVQMVSFRNDDANLFRTANWLVNSLKED